MNTPSLLQVPANIAAAANLNPKFARGADKKHNREIGHQLKAASLHRPAIIRSVPHVRGR